MAHDRHFTPASRLRNVVTKRPPPAQTGGEAMPMLYIDLIEGRTPSEVQALLSAAHDAGVDAFAVPPRDRYQVVHTHPAHEIVAFDTGLGIDRSERLVVVHVVSRRRTRAMKERFYELLAGNPARR